MNPTNGFLVLSSGEIFKGNLYSAGKETAGEVVFHTAHSGYQEIASDPSYFSQIMVMTAPMQGNYGHHPSDWESSKYWIEGFVCLEIDTRDNDWLKDLNNHGVPVLAGVDTRELTLTIREKGATWGAIVQADSESGAEARAKEFISAKRTLIGQDWTKLCCSKEKQILKGDKKNHIKIAVIDFGTKTNILKELLKRVEEVYVYPSGVSSDEIKADLPNGILLTNGPGDPAWVTDGIQTVRQLLGWRPIFGICMGHQVLSLALGAKTYKMKFGHHGANHPVRDLLLEKVYITSQNHGYAVDEKTLPHGARVTQKNLYDQSVEGFEFQEKKCFSVQYHPESAPGPNDARPLFDLFVDSLR